MNYTSEFLGETNINATQPHNLNGPEVSTGAEALILDRNSGLITVEFDGTDIVMANHFTGAPFPVSITGGEIFVFTRDGLGAIRSVGIGGANQTLKTYSRAPSYMLTEQSSAALGYHLVQWPPIPSADGAVFAAYTDNAAGTDPRFRIYEGSIASGYSVAFNLALGFSANRFGSSGIFEASSSTGIDGPACSADGSLVLTAHPVDSEFGAEIYAYEKVDGVWTETAHFDPAFFGETYLSRCAIRIAPDGEMAAVKYIEATGHGRISVIRRTAGIWSVLKTILGGYWSDFRNA